MNSYLSILNTPSYSDKDYRFAHKVVPKIFSTNLLDFVRNPQPQRSMFQYVVTDRDKEFQYATLMVVNYDDNLHYTQQYQIENGGTFIQYDLITPFGDLMGFDIIGNSKIHGTVTIHKGQPTFFETTLPEYLLKYYGITSRQKVYYLIEEIIKNEIKYTIGNVEQVREKIDDKQMYYEKSKVICRYG